MIRTANATSAPASSTPGHFLATTSNPSPAALRFQMNRPENRPFHTRQITILAPRSDSDRSIPCHPIKSASSCAFGDHRPSLQTHSPDAADKSASTSDRISDRPNGRIRNPFVDRIDVTAPQNQTGETAPAPSAIHSATTRVRNTLRICAHRRIHWPRRDRQSALECMLYHQNKFAQVNFASFSLADPDLRP